MADGLQLERVTGAGQVGVKVRLADGSYYVAPVTVSINAAGDAVAGAGGAAGLTLNSAGQLEVVQPDQTNSQTLDLSALNNAAAMPITNGQGVVGIDVTGLTDSGATLVCEMQIANGPWRLANMLVNGTAGIPSQSITADATFRVNASARSRLRMRVSTAGTGTATVAEIATTNSSVVQLSAPLPPGANVIGKMGLDGLLPAFAAPPAFTLTGTPSVSVSNFPTAFNVGNFPASQAVTGTFWQATQPISAAALPLPAGAATASGVQAVVTALGTPMQQTGGTVTANLGTLNGAATAALQGTGNDRLASILTALGGTLTVGGTVLTGPNGAASGAVVPVRAINATSLVAKASAGNFYGATAVSNPSGSAAYVLVLDRTTVPASGYVFTAAEIVAMTGFAAGGIASVVPDQMPDRCANGCVVVCSTSPTTYTPLTANLPYYIKARIV